MKYMAASSLPLKYHSITLGGCESAVQLSVNAFPSTALKSLGEALISASVGAST